MNPQQEDVMNSVTQSVDATSNMENGAEDTSSEDTFSEGTLPEAASHSDAPTQKADSAALRIHPSPQLPGKPRQHPKFQT